MITADADLSNIETSHIGVSRQGLISDLSLVTDWTLSQPLNRLHGFSSFKFVPGSHDSVIVAVKSEENKGSIASYMLAFDLSGRILMAEQKIADFKYVHSLMWCAEFTLFICRLEGIEFI